MKLLPVLEPTWLHRKTEFMVTAFIRGKKEYLVSGLGRAFILEYGASESQSVSIIGLEHIDTVNAVCVGPCD
jgi:hypothetical protein